jgi:hypothetical protein
MERSSIAQTSRTSESAYKKQCRDWNNRRTGDFNLANTRATEFAGIVWDEVKARH